MKYLIAALLCVALACGMAFAETSAPPTPAEFLADKGYQTYYWSSATEEGIDGFQSGSGHENQTLCMLYWTRESNAHRIIWRESNGDVYLGVYGGETVANLVSPLIAHLKVIGDFADMCEACAFDLGMFSDGSTCVFGTAEKDTDLLGLAVALSAGKPTRLTTDWEMFKSALVSFN